MKQSSDFKNKNIVLIGMCGAGKSTIGVLLAKGLSRYFLDTDVYIQALEGKSLQQIIDDVGLKKFCEIEEKHILCLNVINAVIATGGSVVYSKKAMEHLKSTGVVIHLDLDYESVEKRVTNLYTRGVVMEKGQTLRGLYDKRMPLYRKYADITIDGRGKTQQQIADEIAKLTVC